MVIWCVSLPEELWLIYKLRTGDRGRFLKQRWNCHLMGPTDALVCLAHPHVPGRWQVPPELVDSRCS